MPCPTTNQRASKGEPQPVKAEHSRPRHCIVPACRRFAATGSTVCWPHRKSPTGRDWDTAIRQAARDSSEAASEGNESSAAERFRRRIAQGQYRQLFDVSLARILAQAAEHRDLDDEVGAVRFALARLIAEEPNPARLALGVARLTHAAVATSRERRECAQGQPDGLTEAMVRILAELGEKEKEAEAEATHEFQPLTYIGRELS